MCHSSNWKESNLLSLYDSDLVHESLTVMDVLKASAVYVLQDYDECLLLLVLIISYVVNIKIKTKGLIRY